MGADTLSGNDVYKQKDKDRLESAPGSDKDNWPNMADTAWAEGIHSYYGTMPYVEETHV